MPGIAPTADLYGDLALALANVGRWGESYDAARAGRTVDFARADIWQTEARALSELARLARDTGKFDDARQHDEDALTAFASARALIFDDPGKLALLAELRAVYVGAGRWAEALATVNDELALAPGAPTRLTAKLELLRRLKRDAEALSIARTLAARPEASGADWLALAQLAHVAGADAEAAQALLRAEGMASEGMRLAPDLRAALFPLPEIPARRASLGYRGVNRAGTPAIIPPLVSVSAGPFLMGSDKQRDTEVFDDETPQHRVELAAFQIGKYPVTVAEYALAVRAGAVREPPASRQGLIRIISRLQDQEKPWQAQLQHLDHPVVCVSWQDTQAYLAWLREATGQPDWRLPSEAQWEKAARWDAARGVSRIYPWGDSFDKMRCNTRESGIGTTTAVGEYPASDAQRSGASPCGAEDMAGNVWEWTSSLFKPYHYISSDDHGDQNSVNKRTLRGGSWYGFSRSARAPFRNSSVWDYFDNYGGFRLALPSPAGS